MKDIVTGRALHEHVRGELQAALGSRTWSWLAREAGVPQSTLSNQVNGGKFSLEVLVRVAAALDRHVVDFLPDPAREVKKSRQAERLIAELEELLAEARHRLKRVRAPGTSQDRDIAS